MKRVRLPKRIKRGSCVVTIYRSPTNGYDSFTVVHYDAKVTRCRRSLADYKRARQAAVEVASTLSEGRSDMLLLTGQELLVYRRAMKALRPTRTSLDAAAVRFAELMRRNNGGSEDSASAPVQCAGQPVKSKLVAEVLKELLAAKREEGRSHLYLTDLRVRLTRFAGAFDRPLAEVTAGGRTGFAQGRPIGLYEGAGTSLAARRPEVVRCVWTSPPLHTSRLDHP